MYVSVILIFFTKEVTVSFVIQVKYRLSCARYLRPQQWTIACGKLGSKQAYLKYSNSEISSVCYFTLEDFNTAWNGTQGLTHAW